MNPIYRVTIHGRTLEDTNLRSLLKRAVREKRDMDRVLLEAGAGSQMVPRTEEPESPATAGMLGT